jgi:hypothetical protein
LCAANGLEVIACKSIGLGFGKWQLLVTPVCKYMSVDSHFAAQNVGLIESNLSILKVFS